MFFGSLVGDVAMLVVVVVAIADGGGGDAVDSPSVKSVQPSLVTLYLLSVVGNNAPVQ